MQRKQAFKYIKTPETSFIPHSDGSLFFATPRGKQTDDDVSVLQSSYENALSELKTERETQKDVKRENKREMSQSTNAMYFFEFCKTYFIHAFLLTLFVATFLNQSNKMYEQLEDLQKQIYTLQNKQQKIDTALKKDKNALLHSKYQNYACLAKNAYIDTKNTTRPYLKSYFRVGKSNTNDPNIVLSSNYTQGSCYAFPGSSGNIFIVFSVPVYIKNIQIFHPKTKNRSSAIKNFIVIGITDDKSAPIGTYEYSLSDKVLQTYNLGLNIPYTSVSIQVLSNHGHKKYTCVYKISINGAESK